MAGIHKYGTYRGPGEEPANVELYPLPGFVSQRSGGKVAWRTYDTIEAANACAKIARYNAEIKTNEGYDFGFCSPGTITKVEGGWEVCIP